MPDLPSYEIRESARARRVLLKVYAREGLVVVVPKGFDHSRVPAIVDRRREWIEQTLVRLRRDMGAGSAQALDTPPESLEFRAFGEEWAVGYVDRQSEAFALRENAGGRLLVSGPLQDTRQLRASLTDFCRKRARLGLAPMLSGLGEKLGIPFERLQVRAQKTRWGSRSARGTISLNCKLAFLTPELARYVMIHELCHVRHMDHSTRFWSLCRRLEPETDRLEAELKRADRFVPPFLR